MATLKLAYWKKPKSVLVSDETKTLTIAYWPKVELVVITAVPAAGGGDTVWVKMRPNRFWGPF